MEEAGDSRARADQVGAVAGQEGAPGDASAELKRARLSNGYLRARLASMEEAHRALEEKSAALEAELRRVARELSTATEELATERAARAGAYEELTARHARDRDRAELAAAGWRVERQRRVRAELQAARFEAMRVEHHTAVSAELDRLMELVARWREAAASEDVGQQSVPEASEQEPGRRRARRRHRIGSRPAPLRDEASMAGVLLARALELAAGEVETHAGAYQLVGLADGDIQAVEDAIARADKVMWDTSAAAPEGNAVGPDISVEVAGRMPVLVAGASSLLNTAREHMRAT
jgi:hypothetical protein